MPTNPNMVAIQTVTVGSGGAANIEFTNIPQTYTDLVLKVSVRSNISAYRSTLVMQFNADTGNNYAYRRLYATGSTAGSDSTDPTSYVICGEVVGASSTASTFTNSEIYIPNYTSSNQKSVSTDATLETNDTSNNRLSLTAAKWTGTSAITSIKLFDSNTAQSFVQYSSITLYGVTSSGYGAKATGGIITSDANYYYHTFLASGTFTPTQNLTADYLVVAGGGGGGGNIGGGGGAGGVKTSIGGTALSLSTSTSYTVTVGAGGVGGDIGPGATITTSSAVGSNSSISGTGITTVTSTGGGRGGDNPYQLPQNGGNGGSGGGGASRIDSAGTSTGGTGNSGEGNNGGSTSANGAAGGGGAGAVGSNGAAGVSGAGGAGISNSITGSSVTYGGGGGGGGLSGVTVGAGGSGGGGAGGGATNQTGTAGSANTGGAGGGGGGGNGAAKSIGGAGGSGIVIVRYAK